jgi:hypothetical protein
MGQTLLDGEAEDVGGRGLDGWVLGQAGLQDLLKVALDNRRANTGIRKAVGISNQFLHVDIGSGLWLLLGSVCFC